ncbi:GTP cyclohydrolase FolE2 [Aquicoccus sp. G2-2]|jgi:GTP cyclohydrolase I|uniref:GTP cyclohydrolase FolE2 n=1 Tax=Aquicoccus sp. G2-2 TaxID=3092120 RepID=UPI0036731FA0
MTTPFTQTTPAGSGPNGTRTEDETARQERDYPAFSSDYPEDFLPDAAYRATMPDLQNGPAALIRGARRKIQHVGISNFRVPLRFRCRDATEMTLQVSVTGTVSLAEDRKGINMSRIMRSFYRHGEVHFDFDTMAAVLDDYLRDLESTDARLLLRFCYPLKVMSLRSGLAGVQYYDIAMELVGVGKRRRRVLHLDYVYSSTCPCSLELSEHARRERHQLATPHSQRSVARISVELHGPNRLWIEDLVDMARKAVPTETQVMVKREDEQAFAELNAANPIFVEDAARLFSVPLQEDPRIGDFRIVASHQESLHSHDAISVLTAGDSFAAPGLEPALFETMIKAG